MVHEIKIKCFLSLAETLSFTETAKELYMTQQAVSKHIARLEGDFGFPLFSRTKRSVALTPEGERCRNLFLPFRAQYQAFLAEGRANHGHFGNTLRIGYQNWLDIGSAPGRALTEMRKELPALEVASERRSPDKLYEGLRAGKLDLIYILGSYIPDMEGLAALPLSKIPLVLMVSPQHPAVREGATWRSFLEEPVLFDSFERETPAETVLRAEKKIAECSLGMRKIIVVPNRDSVFTDVEMGRGVAIGAATSQFVRGGDVVVYPLEAEDALLCVWRANERNLVVRRYAACAQKAYQDSDV